jgi:hypothetical protein
MTGGIGGRPFTAAMQDADVLGPPQYNATEGFVAYIDVVANLPATVKHLYVKYSLAQESRRLTDTFSSAMVHTNNAEEEGSDDTQSDDGADAGADAGAATSGAWLRAAKPTDAFLYAQDCAADPLLSFVIELHVPSAEADRAAAAAAGGTQMVAWTKLYLFESSMRLAAGRWRLNLRSPPLKLGCLSTELQTLPSYGNAVVGVRLIDARLKVQHDLLSTGPAELHRYLHSGVLGHDILAMLAKKEDEAKVKAEEAEAARTVASKKIARLSVAWSNGKSKGKGNIGRPASAGAAAPESRAASAAKSKAKRKARALGTKGNMDTGDLYIRVGDVVGFDVSGSRFSSLHANLCEGG